MKKNRKSYNPFKMWGSYVIPVLSIYDYFAQAYVDKIFCINLNHVSSMSTGTTCSNIIPEISSILSFGIKLPGITYYILVILIWFLIGWGIHSAFRRYWR